MSGTVSSRSSVELRKTIPKIDLVKGRNYYITSDTHLNHRNIITYASRPFHSTESMNNAIIRNINKQVNSGTLIHLGDVAFCGTQKMEEFMSRLLCPIILVRGNHDKKSRGFRDLFQAYYPDNGARIEFEGKHILLRHRPVFATEVGHERHTEDQPTEPELYAAFDGILHGHIHLTKDPIREKNFDVGMDANNYTPQPLELQIERVLRGYY